nr:hypothetical protein [Tanacetum cinerariifolium]
MEAQDGEIPLLELTKDRVVPLAGVYDRGNANAQDARNDDVNEGVNDVAEAGQAERGDRVMDIEGIEIVADDEIQAIEDHGTSGDAGASVAGKSLAALQGLLEMSTLAAEFGATTAAIVPFVMSSVTPTPEHEGGRGEDSATGSIIRTRPTLERFVVLIDSSYYSGTNAVDDEATFIVRSSVPPPLILTVAVTTTVVLGATSVPVHDLGMGQVYILKWNVINDFVLDDPDVCRVLESLARQACFSAKVRMQLEHELRGRQKLEERYAQQVDRLKERDTKIASLKTQLSLKEAEAAKAIHLCGQITAVGATKATRIAELNSLRERSVSLEGQVATLESAVVSRLEATCFRLRVEVMRYKLFKEQVEEMQDEQMKVLSDRVASIDCDLMEMVLHMDTEFYPRYLTTIARLRWILSRRLRLVLAKCLASPKYLSAMGEAIGRTIDKGMQDGLIASIEHGRAGRGIADVATFNPSAESDYVASINALRDVNFSLLAQLEANEDSSKADIMDLLFLKLPLPRPLKLASCNLRLSNLWFQFTDWRIRGDATARRLSLTDFILPLVKPLSARNLTSEASSFAILATDVTTALSTTFAQTDPVPSVLSTEVPPSSKIIFEYEDLDTTPEHVLAS